MSEIGIVRDSFERRFKKDDFYNKQTQDDKHLEFILNKAADYLESGGKILDLGTGSGYVAFAMAKKFPECEVTGLDILEDTLQRNRLRARELDVTNLHFRQYDGLEFPFEDQQYDFIVTRYAIHHFENIATSFNEISRVLKKDGAVFISDPTPYEEDTEKFIDNYMKLRKDGHKRFYKKRELLELARNNELECVESLVSEIRFPRKIHKGYNTLLDSTSKNILELYKTEIIGEECYVTEPVNNIIFNKK